MKRLSPLEGWSGAGSVIYRIYVGIMEKAHVVLLHFLFSKRLDGEESRVLISWKMDELKKCLWYLWIALSFFSSDPLAVAVPSHARIVKQSKGVAVPTVVMCRFPWSERDRASAQLRFLVPDMGGPDSLWAVASSSSSSSHSPRSRRCRRRQTADYPLVPDETLRGGRRIK